MLQPLSPLRPLLQLAARLPTPLSPAGQRLLIQLALLALARSTGRLTDLPWETPRTLLPAATEQLGRGPGTARLFGAGRRSPPLPDGFLAAAWQVLGQGTRPLPVRLLADLLEGLRETRDRRGRGSFYTPDWVIEWLLDRTGVPLADDPAGGLVDPACGGGAFLLAAYQRLPGAPAQRLGRLAGVDLDPVAVAVAQASLWLLLPPDDPAAALLPGRIVEGDALRGAPGAWSPDAPRSLHPLHWPRRFPPGPGGHPFSHLLGNPPYRQLAATAPELDRLGPYYAGQPANLFALFLRRSLDLVRPTGVIGLVLPVSLARVKAYAPSRELLARAGHVETVADLGRATAAAGYEQLAVVLRPTGTGPPPTARTRLVRLRDGQEEHTQEGLQARLVQRPGIPLALDPAGRELLTLLEQRHPPLGELCTIRRGLPFSVNQPGFSVDVRPEAVPCLRGADIGRYQVRGHGWWLDTPDTRARSTRLRQWLGQPKLVMPNIVSSKVQANAALDEAGHLSLDTVTNLLPREGVSLTFLLALLNSGLCTYLLREGIFHGALLTNHLDAPYLGRLPVPDPGCAQAGRLSELAAGLGRAPDPAREQELDALVLDAYCLPERPFRARLAAEQQRRETSRRKR
ncbi:MAG: TaqI-like C-terminal specificity domain-containing protein [Myxococcota bacterium]|jgi:hypothetical protein|nr:TaqI-like C-terminal specificity domain-containing protein [Myxococcota bacterium]